MLSIQFATFLLSICVTLSSAKTKDRSIHIAVLMTVAAIGNAIATATPVKGARYCAMFLMPMGSVSSCKSRSTREKKVGNMPGRFTNSSIPHCRPDHRFVGRQLLPSTSRQALGMHRHLQHDRKHGDHLRLLHVSRVDGPSIHPWRDYQHRDLHGRCGLGDNLAVCPHMGKQEA